MTKKIKIWVTATVIVLIAGGITSGLVYRHYENRPKCPNPTIKGNISYSTGVKIYHLLSDRDYKSTVIDTSTGERWFCTEQDAQTAGWRHTEAQ